MPLIGYAEGWSASTNGESSSARRSSSAAGRAADVDRDEGPARRRHRALRSRMVQRLRPRGPRAADDQRGAGAHRRAADAAAGQSRTRRTRDAIAQIVREAQARRRDPHRAPASTARCSCSAATRERTPCRRSCSPPSTTTWSRAWSNAGMPVKMRVNVQTRFLTDRHQELQRPRGDPRHRSGAEGRRSCCSARTSTPGTRRRARPTTPTAAPRRWRRCGSSRRSACGRGARSASRSGAARKRGCSARARTSGCTTPARRTPPPARSWRCI